jgi:membrane-associated phospholipid phosphatase
MTTLASRLRAEPRWKLAGVALYVGAFTAYALIQHWRSGSATLMPWTPVDLQIPVLPWLLAPYLLQLAVLGVPTLLMDDRRLLRAHLAGYLVINLVALGCFAAMPTMIARAPHGDALLALVRAVDGTGNACPSLHAACVVYAALALPRALPIGALVLAAVWTWVALVLVACISLRQHTGYDLAAGAVLAWAVDRGVAWWLARGGQAQPQPLARREAA